MNKKVILRLLILTCLGPFSYLNEGFAQNYNRVFEFSKGNKFQTEITTKSNAIVQRGRKNISVTSESKVNKTYEIKDANKLNYTLEEMIDKMSCSIDANGFKTNFDSQKPHDEKSSILNGLAFIVKKPLSITIDRYGAVRDFEEFQSELATDTLISFAGLQPEVLTKSILINFLADFTFNKRIKKGYSWPDNLTIGDQRYETTFTVDYIDEKNTILKFVNRTRDKLINTNSNGTYVIDNATGIILEKYIYSTSVGFQISAGNTTYSVSRTMSLMQKTKLVK